MLISVLMSVYNSEQSIFNSVQSILNQTYSKFEFLIMDDASTDNSYSILKDLSKTDNRIKLLKNQNNLGLTKSLNILIQHSNGEVIARHDADDLSIVSRFETQIEQFSLNNLDICTSRAVIKDSQKIIPGFSYYLPLRLAIKLKNPFIHGTLMIKRSSLLLLNNYDENFYYAQDYKLMSDAIKLNFKIKNLNKKLYVLNMNNNISTNYKNEQKYFSECVRKNRIPNIS